MIIKICTACFILLFTLGCDKVEYSEEPLEHHSYIWNRKTSDSLSENIRYSNNFLNGFSILASELSWVKGNARVKCSELPKEKYGINSISIRVNDYKGDINDKADTLLEITKTSLERYKNNGFDIKEIQFDFDCPSSQLKSYASLLNHLKKHFDEQFSVTALPSWLKHKSFKKVIAACDNYVLQLHSLALHKNIDNISPLFDQNKAEKWVIQAAKLGKSFSISLPTYGYFLGFDEKGNYLGVSSEQGPKNWPQTKVLLTDSQSVNSFIKKINARHPKHLKSVFWFRLHNKSDTLNWNSDALRSLVLGHEIYRDECEIVYEKQNLALTDISLRNNSSIPIVLKKGEKFELQQQNILFADSMQNFSLEEVKENSVSLTLDQTIVIPPGKSIPACWLRSRLDPKEKTKS